jgi:hypothetical protein
MNFCGAGSHFPVNSGYSGWHGPVLIGTSLFFVNHFHEKTWFANLSFSWFQYSLLFHGFATTFYHGLGKILLRGLY